MSVFDIISEPLLANFKLSRDEVEERVKLISRKTGLNLSYLAPLSACVLRRATAADRDRRALDYQARLIVCDEAVSALDVVDPSSDH